MNSFGRRVLSLLLCICMALSVVPMAAFADETATEPQTTVGTNTEPTTGVVAETPTEEPTEAPTEAPTEPPVPAEPVKYTVAHYLWSWDANDYVLLETEELTGIPGELTKAQEKTYEGRILETDIEQVEILEDGTTVVAVYYIELLEEAIAFVETDLYDTSVSNGYFNVISADTYELAPGAVEHEIVLNNADSTDRKVVHVFEVDTYNEDLEVMPGYYAIDKLDPDNLALDGIVDKAKYWTDKQLSQTVKYYENVLGYNVVGAMNTALAYDSNAPYGYMVWNGVVLGTPEVHKGAQTYLAIDWEGNCELRSMSTPLDGSEKTAISANFNWLVKDGKLESYKTEERTSSDASRSMIGIKADGTLIFCQVDGRNAPVSTGLSNYEMGEAMLALGCVNAVNCDGGGSSTFISKRATDKANIMRSVPSDGSERATINSVILVSTAGASGIFNKVAYETETNYIAPTASMAVSVTGLDTKGFTMDIPADVTYQVEEEGMGTIQNGIFTAGAETGTATIQAVYDGKVVGEKVLNVVHPETFGFTEEETVIPYGKTIKLVVETTYGVDDWDVCVDGAYTFKLSDDAAATLNGIELTASEDETVKGVNVTVTYTPDTSKTDVLKVTYGKGSEIIFDFENGDLAGFMGFKDAKKWSQDNAVNNSLVGSDPLAGQFSEQVDGYTSISSAADGGIVKNGDHALAWTADYTDAGFAGWTYNVLFRTGEPVVLRDVANGKNATTLGMWLYIPEGAAGLAFQSQLYSKNADGTLSCHQDHFVFDTVSGVRKNLNSCTEADIPTSRWVYASIDISKYDYLQTADPKDTSNSRSPSFVRTYVKPTNPYVLTFYIDDITLDYSSAVDDRVAPVIDALEYSSADTAVELGAETVINASSAAFSAKVSDLGSLNLSTAQIYVDGNKVETQVVNGVMSTKDSVTLENGTHKVTYEIADDLGNYTQKSVIFKVAYSEEKSLVYVEGHNDSGAMPEYDSVYYVDIKTSDISKIETVEANIKLNSANNWELEHMSVAEGFSVEWEVMEPDNTITTMGVNTDIHTTDNVANVIITKTGYCPLTGEQTLVSLPVRLWSWNGFNHITGKPVTPEEQFKTGYCPVVTVDYEVLFGYAETPDGEVVSFNGNASVETMINDTVNPWHYHDKELTIQNQAATCTVNGYENRTYCETCKSVVDWGTKLEAKGHNYAVVGDQLVCDCSESLSGTGVVKANGKLYYLIADKLMTGWQSIGATGYCYADPATKEVQTGEFTVEGVTYTANEEGLMLGGAWVENFLGRRYSYGPKFYRKAWATIDGKQYYFGSDAYACTGYKQIRDNENNKKTPFRWFLFGEDGALIDDMKSYCGFLEVDGERYFLENGIGNTYIGTTRIDDNGYASDTGSYYYLDEAGKVMTGKQWVGSYIQSFSKYPLPVGNYEFDAEGKMLDGVVTKEDGTYYYEMGKPVDTGWLKVGNDYYVFTNGGKALTGRNWVGTYLNETSKNPYKSGNFIFAKDGKLANGVVETDDGWYYCEAGVGKEAYLVCVGGEYYYAEANGKLTSGRIWVGTYPSHGLIPKGYYEFGADGKMLSGVVTKEDGTYYYEKGRPVDTGWLKVGDDYYVFTNGGKALTGYNWVGTYLTQTSRDPYRKGNFYFDANGKLCGGVTEMEDGWYYYEAGVAKAAGLINIDGTYYLAETDGKLATGRVWVGTYASNGLLSKGYYEFGADGKMLQGVVEKADGLYYYDLGNTKNLGLIERDGEYYYVGEGGKLEIGRVWVGSYASNGLMGAGYREFGEDGAMLNGFEKLSDGLYYYNKGVAVYHGLKVIGSDLYYIEEGGKVMTGYVYVGTYASNGLVPKGYYTFNEEGKFVR